MSVPWFADIAELSDFGTIFLPFEQKSSDWLKW